MNLSDALSDSLDKQILTGATTGLLTSTVLADHNVSAVTTYANYRASHAYGRVDGKYANAVGDIRIVMGSATYAHAAAAFRSDNAGDRAAIEDLSTVTAGVKVSAHIPAVSAHKQNSASSGSACAAIPSRRFGKASRLIPDEITKAGNRPNQDRDGGNALRLQGPAGRRVLQTTVVSTLRGLRGAVAPTVRAGGRGEIRARQTPAPRESGAGSDRRLPGLSIGRLPMSSGTAAGAIRFAMIGCLPLTEYVRRAIISGAVSARNQLDCDQLATATRCKARFPA